MLNVRMFYFLRECSVCTWNLILRCKTMIRNFILLEKSKIFLFEIKNVHLGIPKTLDLASGWTTWLGFYCSVAKFVFGKFPKGDFGNAFGVLMGILIAQQHFFFLS